MENTYCLIVEQQAGEFPGRWVGARKLSFHRSSRPIAPFSCGTLRPACMPNSHRAWNGASARRLSTAPARQTMS
jgi:hypothetical protein